MGDDMNPVKDTYEMIGDFCREAAVLVLVFATLDQIIAPGGLKFWLELAVLGVVSIFLVVGIAFEKWRRTNP
jgi:hypothetical protein